MIEFDNSTNSFSTIVSDLSSLIESNSNNQPIQSFRPDSLKFQTLGAKFIKNGKLYFSTESNKLFDFTTPHTMMYMPGVIDLANPTAPPEISDTHRFPEYTWVWLHGNEIYGPGLDKTEVDSCVSTGCTLTFDLSKFNFVTSNVTDLSNLSEASDATVPFRYTQTTSLQWWKYDYQ